MTSFYGNLPESRYLEPCQRPCSGGIQFGACTHGSTKTTRARWAARKNTDVVVGALEGEPERRWEDLAIKLG